MESIYFFWSSDTISRGGDQMVPPPPDRIGLILYAKRYVQITKLQILMFFNIIYKKINFEPLFEIY